MKNKIELNIEILKTTGAIQENYPELAKYEDEMTITLPSQNHPEISASALNDYNEALQAMADGYAKSAGQQVKKLFQTLFLLLCFGGSSFAVHAQILLDLESGLVTTGYNNVRIAGNNGTLFSLKDDLPSKATLFYRARLNYTLKSRHTFSLLYAPLQTSSEGSVDKDILFEGVVFPANRNIIGTYKFNSYRLTYRYAIINKPKLVFGLGFTAKIRDAKIALASENLNSEKTNLGFVPIINFRLAWNIDKKWGLLLDGDALAAPQGRAEDVLAAVTYKLNNQFDIRAGYRLLEGGADNKQVYNFALFHYAAVGLSYSFVK